MNYSKVQITGINTSKIQVLTEEEKTELIKRAQKGDKAAKDKMVMCNLKLVLRTIQPFLSRGDDPDDIFEVGTIGLLKAVDRFDTDMGVKFSSYCVPLILGECKRYFRDGGALRVSRSVRDNAYKVFKKGAEDNSQYYTLDNTHERRQTETDELPLVEDGDHLRRKIFYIPCHRYLEHGQTPMISLLSPPDCIMAMAAMAFDRSMKTRLMTSAGVISVVADIFVISP